MIWVKLGSSRSDWCRWRVQADGGQINCNKTPHLLFIIAPKLFTAATCVASTFKPTAAALLWPGCNNFATYNFYVRILAYFLSFFFFWYAIMSVLIAYKFAIPSLCWLWIWCAYLLGYSRVFSFKCSPGILFDSPLNIFARAKLASLFATKLYAKWAPPINAQITWHYSLENSHLHSDKYYQIKYI